MSFSLLPLLLAAVAIVRVIGNAASPQSPVCSSWPDGDGEQDGNCKGDEIGQMLIQRKAATTKEHQSAALEEAAASALKDHVSHTKGSTPRLAALIDSQLDLVGLSRRPGGPKVGHMVDNVVESNESQTGVLHVVDQVAATCDGSMNASRTSPTERCPSECGFWAEDKQATNACFFKCVPSLECGAHGTDPLALIADPEGYCRRCKVPGCTRCSSEPTDTCSECAPGYILKDGKCDSVAIYLWATLTVITSIVVAILLVYIVDLAIRKTSNAPGIEEGMTLRSRALLHQPEPEEGSAERRPWPLSTNLLSVPIAGRGTLLMFNFQALVFAWALAMTVGWWVTASVIDGNLFILGLVQAVTPRQYCTVIHWGFTTQHQLMWVKCAFCIVAYLISFVGCIVYATYQSRRFNLLDSEHTTMMDFAVLCTGLPKQSGAAEVESDLKRFFEQQTGQQIVGVSVCWDTSKEEDDIGESVEKDLSALNNHALGVSPRRPEEQAQSPSTIRAVMDHVDGLIGGILGVQETFTEAEGPDAVQNMLTNLYSTGCAFVVFETEAATHAAAELCQSKGGFKFDSTHTAQLEMTILEPEAVLYQNFHIDIRTIPFRIFVGSLFILSALACWCIFFFLPTALYVASYTDLAGEEPGIFFATLLTVLVVIGNQVMYFLCDYMGSMVRFRSEDDRQAAYVMSYTIACTLNVIMDLSLVAFSSYHMMVSLGIHTDSGSLLEDLVEKEAIFEAYSMQKNLGKQLYGYAFPATFLIPFIVEPFGTVAAPWLVQKLLLRSKPFIRGHAAQRSLAHFTPMDLSRYGDLLLNVILASGIVFLPPGFMFKMFLYLTLSHVFIFCYDHLRVLRYMPGFCYAGSVVDTLSQGMLSIPLGILLAGFVFKGNCGQLMPCLHGWSLFGACFCAFFGHIAVHVAILTYVVPKWSEVDHEKTAVPYSEAAKEFPCNWFTSNPVHCLRSKYVHKETKPCVKFERGLEHLQVANPKIGCYYEAPLSADFTKKIASLK